MPRQRSAHHPFTCFDGFATDSFYREVMDFPLVFAMSGPSPEWGGDFLLIGYAIGDGRHIDFFAVRAMRSPPKDGLPDDIHHVAFATGSARALERWKARLAEHDVSYRIEDHGQGDEHLYFADPNGLTLEIAVRSSIPASRSDSRAARRISAMANCIAEEVENMMGRLRIEGVTPTIVNLREQLEEIRAGEVAKALRGSKSVVWVPAPLVGLATVMKLIPRPVWRTMKS